MRRELGAWKDRASRRSDRSITTCKESWDTLRLRGEVRGGRGARGVRGRAELNWRGLGGQ